MRKFLLCLLVCLSFASVVGAQDNHLLQGQTEQGVIDAGHLLQVYRFAAVPDQPQDITLRNTGTIPLNFAVVDAAGDFLEAPTPIAPNTNGSYTNWRPTQAGSYYLFIFPAAALDNNSGSFEVRVSPSGTPTAVTTNSIGTLQIVLTWQNAARLSLEVRDPGGQFVHWRNQQSADGGSFTGTTDPVDCATFAPHTQTQTISWSAPPTGSYEILVHYIDGCTTDSIPFSVNARYGQTTYQAINGAAQPNDTFVTGFVVGSGSGNFTGRSGVVNANTTLPFSTADLSAAAQPLPADGSATGSISNDQPFAAFSFTGQLGALIDASVTRTSGSLDTYLLLLDANGNVIAFNDDLADGITDSAISGARLPRAEKYLLIVTRYGFNIGVTEGSFGLTVSGM